MVGLTPLSGAPAPANLDESKVPAYTLPDPLVDAAGRPVRDADSWKTRRRGELLELFAREMYGRTPPGRPADMRFDVTSVDATALGGRATRKEVTIWFGAGASSPRMHLLIYQPNGFTGPRPVFLGLNFFGNHTVHVDPGISLADPLVVYDVERYRPAATPVPPAPPQRGVHAEKWQIETVLARGYATATVWCHDLCPDRVEGLDGNVAAWYRTGGTEDRAEDAWGAVGVWAWGLSRALDYLENEPALDARRVIVHGFSRLAKAAVWAAAQDERFAVLVSNESGCGGAALSKRVYGETVGLINHRFPHWFARAFRKYNDREADLPMDQHQLLALIAPRPLYVASAVGDQWSDPKGEFLALRAAEPVYALFRRRGLGVASLPEVDRPVMNDGLGYHLRSGKHDLNAYDWAQFLDFADRALDLGDRRLAEGP